MKIMAGIVLLAALQQSCIEQMAGPPEQVAEQAARQFRAYFPKVQAHADPQRRMIFVVTCAEGLGAPFLQAIEPQVAQQLANSPDLQKLRMASIAEAFGQRVPYNELHVVFEDRSLVWTRINGNVERRWNPPQLTKMYREGCQGEVSPQGLNSGECVTVRNAITELKLKSSERATVRELIEMNIRYCRGLNNPDDLRIILPPN